MLPTFANFWHQNFQHHLSFSIKNSNFLYYFVHIRLIYFGNLISNHWNFFFRILHYSEKKEKYSNFDWTSKKYGMRESQCWNCRILLSWFTNKKSREINFATNKSYCLVVSRKIFQVKIIFCFFYTVERGPKCIGTMGLLSKVFIGENKNIKLESLLRNLQRNVSKHEDRKKAVDKKQQRFFSFFIFLSESEVKLPEEICLHCKSCLQSSLQDIKTILQKSRNCLKRNNFAFFFSLVCTSETFYSTLILCSRFQSSQNINLGQAWGW